MSTPATDRPRGAALFYLVAVVATGVSVNTSWRFFAQCLHIDNLYERAALFGVLELALVACGYAMRANVRRPNGTPGAARTLAWLLCGFSAYMAVYLSGLGEGIARVALGPTLALVALHLALGIEVRHRSGPSSGTWSRVGREMRERALSRLGLGDDTRDAVARSRDRAADRAARLATGRVVLCRRTRLARAVRAAGVALDAGTRGRMLAQVAAYRHLGDLMTLDMPSPWVATPDGLADLSGPTDPAEVGNFPVLDGPAGVALSAHLPPVALAGVRRELADTEPDVRTEPRAQRSGRRKPTGGRGRKPEGSPRRTAEETRQVAASLRAQQPDITRAELARRLGISATRLRQVERPEGSGEGSHPHNGVDLLGQTEGLTTG